MNYLFLAMLGIHLAHALVLNRNDGLRESRLYSGAGLIVQTPLFLLAALVAYRYGALSRALLSPVYIVIGLAAGHAVFAASLLAIHRCVEDTRAVFWDLPALWDFAMQSPLVLSRYLSIAMAEEVIYRVAAQGVLLELTGNAPAAILLAAVLFSIVHAHFFRNTFAQSLEFVVFAVLLGVLYHFTGSLIFVVAIHAVRNIEIAYLEYLAKVEELGDAEKAVEAIEQSLFRRSRETI